jgi:formate--tetrahydrofolate ligase
VTGDVDAGFQNLMAHVENVRQFGVPVVVAINRFADDTDEDVELVASMCRAAGVRYADCDIWARGGEGGIELAEEVLTVLNEGEADFQPLYSTDLSLREKLETISTRVYGADELNMTPAAAKQAQQIVENGLGDLPVCVAKTQYSLSDDPTLLGRPRGFDITVREFRISAGAGFVVALTGDVMTMPGLAARPAAEGMRIHADGRIEGLF